MSRIAWGSFAVGVVAAIVLMWFVNSRKKAKA